ncbi:MAG: aminotransferase [Actinomycetota bacterium]
MRFTPTISALTHSPIGAAHALLAHRVNDRPLLDLSQAAPSYAPPPVVLEAVARGTSDRITTGYAPQPGLPALRRAFAADLSAAYGADPDPTDAVGARVPITADDVLITAGCNQAFCLAASSLAGPGDNVVLQTPFYFNHDMWLRVEGIEPRHLGIDQQHHPSVTEAAGLLDERTRAIVLVSPGNPTGVTLPPETIHDFADLARRHDIALIVDETYRSFRPTDDPPHRLFEDPDWRDTVISLHSFSKDLAIPGYRIGALVGGEAIRVEALKVLDCVAISAPAVGQVACVAGLEGAAEWRREQAERVADLQRRFETVMAERPGGFELVTAGAYFGWVRAPGGEPDDTTAAIVRRLVVEHDILVIPGTAFTTTDERMLRFSFANLDADQITELGVRLAEWGRADSSA